jgi:hypothetical protein
MENNDVDLEKLLSESNGEGTNGASAEDNHQAQNDSQVVKTDGKLANESPRANERIRELIDSNKRLADEVEALKAFSAEQFKKTGSTPSSSELDDYLKDVPDEASREVLKKYGEGIVKRISKEFSPIQKEVRSIKFENEFSDYVQKFPSLGSYKEQIRESYEKNPNLKAAIGEILIDNQLAKVRPLEGKSVANRQAPDLDSMSKDELYDLLESNK